MVGRTAAPPAGNGILPKPRSICAPGSHSRNRSGNPAPATAGKAPNWPIDADDGLWRDGYESVEIFCDASGVLQPLIRGHRKACCDQTFAFALAPAGDITGLLGINRHAHIGWIELMHETGRGGELARAVFAIFAGAIATHWLLYS